MIGGVHIISYGMLQHTHRLGKWSLLEYTPDPSLPCDMINSGKKGKITSVDLLWHWDQEQELQSRLWPARRGCLDSIFWHFFTV